MSGRAVVGVDVGPAAETLGDAGVLVQPNDPAELAIAIVGLLRAPGRRRQLGDAARRRALLHFTTDRVVRVYGALYTDLAAPPPAPAAFELALAVPAPRAGPRDVALAAPREAEGRPRPGGAATATVREDGDDHATAPARAARTDAVGGARRHGAARAHHRELPRHAAEPAAARTLPPAPVAAGAPGAARAT